MKKRPSISIIVPNYNSGIYLKKTLESIKKQTFKDFEIIVVDDASNDHSVEIAKKYTKHVISSKKKLGPAASRNIGIKKAKGNILAFLDSDVIARKNWLQMIYDEFNRKNILVLAGNTKINKSTYLANCISALGFPGGGSAGFEKIWHVDENGLTHHISSCNFAAKKAVFRNCGLFDTSFKTAGAEDAEWSYRLIKKKIQVKYVPEMIVFHKARKKLGEFIRWQFSRGRSNFLFHKKVGGVGGYIKLRFWSSKNILIDNLFDAKLPIVFFLLLLSFFLIQIGYFFELLYSKYKIK